MSIAANAECTVCGAAELSSMLWLGEQPPSNRFVAPSTDGPGASEAYPLSLGYCRRCSTAQLVDRMPIDAVRPIYDWIAYNEPEGHLDDVVKVLVGLPGITPSARVLGATYKDASTIERLLRLGFGDGKWIAPEHLPSPVRPFGAETIQGLLSDEANVGALRSIYGSVDVLIARHILEHAWSAKRFIGALRNLLRPDGYMVLELPDSERIFRAGNHAFIWEEHISYFTAASVKRLAQEVGASVAWFGRYPYTYEDSLVSVLRFGDLPGALTDAAVDTQETIRELQAFTAAMEASRSRWRATLEGLRAANEKAAVFGAGHLAAKFINFLGLRDLIDCVLDDHPRKVGLLMPGSHLPIVPSAEMQSRRIRVCISTLSPESEAKVRAKLRGFFDSGGRFVQAFAAG